MENKVDPKEGKRVRKLIYIEDSKRIQVARRKREKQQIIRAEIPEKS